MAKRGTRIRATTARGIARFKTLRDWIEAQLRADPGLRRRINVEIRRLMKEQAAARRKAQHRARKRRAAQKKARAR